MRSRAKQSVPVVVLGVTTAQSMTLLRGFPEHLVASGWEVHVVASGDGGSLPPLPGVHVHDLPMVRNPSFLRDLRSLRRWIRLLRNLRPDLVAIGTPKASLLGLLAAAIVRVPARIYVLRGLRLEGSSGPRLLLYSMLEKITSGCSTAVLAVSHSLRREFVRRRLARPADVVVLGSGSSNGVAIPSQLAAAIDLYGVAADALVVGYVGRICEDKGVRDLISAGALLRRSGHPVHLILVGAEEPRGFLQSVTACHGRDAPEVTWFGHRTEVGPYYAAMDVLCLPTRREGFPNVVLEAAVYERPAVVTDVTGARDSVVAAATGLVVPYGSPEGLAQALRSLTSADVRRSMGTAARQRAALEFSRESVWARTTAFFEEQLAASQLHRPALRPHPTRSRAEQDYS